MIGFDLTEPYVAPWMTWGWWWWCCRYTAQTPPPVTGRGLAIMVWFGKGAGRGVREEKRGIYYGENELRLAGGAGIDISD